MRNNFLGKTTYYNFFKCVLNIKDKLMRENVCQHIKLRQNNLTKNINYSKMHIGDSCFGSTPSSVKVPKRRIYIHKNIKEIVLRIAYGP